MAEDASLLVVPVMPLMEGTSGFRVVLNGENMMSSDFVSLAIAAGVRLLYLEAEPFSSERDLDLDYFEEDVFASPDPIGSESASLMTEAQEYDGRIGLLRLAFAVDGVLHCWIATEDWYNQFAVRITEIAETVRPSSRFGSSPEMLELADRVARELVGMPSFRFAPTAAQRRRVASTEHPKMVEWASDPRYGSVVWRAIQKAEEEIAAETERIHSDMEGRLPELAAEFAQTVAYQNAGSARARRERARDFLTEQSGGFAPSNRLLELLLDTPPLQRPKAAWR
jgi:hypothetical protein